MWSTDSLSVIPFIRLTRYAFSIIRGHQALIALERSQAVPFSLCRMTRVLLFFTVATHGLACAFFYFCTRPEAAHYASAPWFATASTASRYLRSTYWSLMTFTTTGHVDIVGFNTPEVGRDWEIGAAIVVAFVATFVYIYINANFTTMMIRLNSRLEQYRTQLAGIDAYLKRNKVSKDVSKRVKRHFVRANRTDAGSDKALLESLPPSLQREVLQDIHMRTLQRAPTFFGLEPAALAQVCAVVRTVTFLPEEVLCAQGDVVSEMYFLEEGCILYSSLNAPDRGDQPRKSAGLDVGGGSIDCRNKLLKQRGAPMCEVAFLFGLRQEATLEAIGTSKCCVLHKNDFVQLMKDFPDILDLSQRSVVALLRDAEDPIVEEVERMQTKTQKQIAGASDMLYAAASGKLEIVQEAISHGGINVSEADYEGRTALHVAATAGRLDVVQFLINAKANVNRKDNFGKTPLANAITKGHPDVVKELHDAGGELGWSEAETASELCDMAREGHTQRLVLLLACGAHVNAADYDKRTCLHVAASEGNVRICELLHEYKANVNACDRWGGTPLRDAIREGHYHVANMLRDAEGQLNFDEATASGELCELARKGLKERLTLLLKSGCAVNAKDYDARTCLHLAASEGNLSIVEQLVQLDAAVNAKDRWGGTPLRDAVREGHMEVAKALSRLGGTLGYNEAETSGELCELARQGSLDKLTTMLACGVSVNAADYDRRTCLHLAASEGNIHAVEMLLNSGADVNFQDRWGGTPLSDALREGHRVVANLLQERGGDLGMDTLTMAMALCEHARLGKLEALEDLLRCGADPTAVDYDERTALHIAAAEGQKGIAQSLLDKGARPDATDRWGTTPVQDAERAGHNWPSSFWDQTARQAHMERRKSSFVTGSLGGKSAK